MDVQTPKVRGACVSEPSDLEGVVAVGIPQETRSQTLVIDFCGKIGRGKQTTPSLSRGWGQAQTTTGSNPDNRRRKTDLLYQEAQSSHDLPERDRGS
jgi:hypothetical protein